MARRLAEVLHHFDPGLAEPRPAPRAAPAPLVAVPVAPGDLLRAGAVWNLAVEIARRGGPSVVVDAGAELALEEGAGPLGARVERVAAAAPEVRARAVRERADAAGGRLALACLPAEDFAAGFTAGLDFALLLASADAAGLRAAEAQARRVMAAAPAARVGVTLHGVRSIGEARDAFERLAWALERGLGREITSYGLLVDDLALYRAIVERRPVGLAHPQSPAARALSDVAGLLLDDGA